MTTYVVSPEGDATTACVAARGHGAELRQGKVNVIVRRGSGQTGRRVEVDGGVIETDAVVIAMGPWSRIAAGWLGLPAVYGVRSPSLVYDTGTDVPAEALFLEHEDGGAVVTVEVFPRANGNTLVTAFSDQAPLPFDPATIAPEPHEIDRLRAICERLSPAFHADSELLKMGLAAKGTAGDGSRSSHYGVFDRGPDGHKPPDGERQESSAQGA